MKIASGEILTWLNSDDMLAPGTLYAMAMAFWKSNADMVVGTVQMIKDGEVVEEHLTSCPNGPLRLGELLDLDGKWLEGRFFFQPELMFTRDLWERAGGYVDTKTVLQHGPRIVAQICHRRCTDACDRTADGPVSDARRTEDS